jgi:hypothetical protein
MREVKVTFTSWQPWKKRTAEKRPGVYLLGCFRGKPPTGRARPLCSKIIYIGETHQQTLHKRLKDFDRSARTGKKAHAGDRSYHDRILKKKKCDELPGDLYVATATFSPVSSDYTACQSFLIRYVESKLVWEFATKHNPRKLLNKHREWQPKPG